MQALLASPSTRYDSPDSSFGSSSTPSSSGSLHLPALSSPFELGSPIGVLAQHANHNKQHQRQSSPLKQKTVIEGDESFSDEDDDEQVESFESPSRPTTLGAAKDHSPTLPPSAAQPAWMTDELEEEWVQERESDGSSSQMTDSDEDEERSMSMISASQQASPTSAAAFVTASSFPDPGPPTNVSPVMPKYASLNQPKVPSSLRHAFTQSSATESIDGDASTVELPATSYGGVGTFSSDPATISDAGSCVVRSENETRLPSQLAAAVRALRGPGAGLGGPSVGEGDDEGQTPSAAAATPKATDRFGLMKLFEPPSPPTSAPTSTISAPFADEFTFTPPPLERTSYKSLVSPSHSSTSATPIARPRRKPVPTLTPEGTTPPRAASDVAPVAPGLRPKDRVLRSEATAGQVKPSSTSTSTSSSPLLPPVSEEVEVSILDEQPPSIDSPPRTNFSPFPLTPAPQPSTPPRSTTLAEGTPRSAIKLFEFQYDTYTRDHLAALVEEIDRSTSLASQDGRSVWVDVLPRQKATHEDGEEDVAENERSNKRIRLSPRWSWGEAGAATPRRGRRLTSVGSTGRSARKVIVSPTQTRSLVTRQRLDEANSLLDRIRAKATTTMRKAMNERLEEDVSMDQERTVVPASPHEVPHDSPLPRLAAAASASIRHALTESASMSTPGTPPALGGSRSTLGHGRRPSLAQSIIAATNAASIVPSPGRRHFATTPVNHRSSMKRGPTLGERFAPNSSIKITSSSRLSEESTESTATEEEKQSTTGSSTTCATSGSGGTFSSSEVGAQKGHSRHSSLTTIGPQDVSALLLASANGTRTGRMIFDQAQQRWIKTSRASVAPRTPGPVAEVSQEADASASTEDDPFRDFESTRASGEIRDELNRSYVVAATEQVPHGLSGLGITADTPDRSSIFRKENELAVGSPLDACYFEAPPIEEPIEDPPQGDQHDEDDTATWGTGEATRKEYEDRLNAHEESLHQIVIAPTSSPPSSLQLVPRAIPATPRPPIDTPTSNVPRSALKNGTGRSHSDPGLLSTPRLSSGGESKVPRSVSFSDGKAEGKIEGLVAVVIEERFGGAALTGGGSRLKFQMSTISDSTQASGEELGGEPGSLVMNDEEALEIGQNSPSLRTSLRTLTRSMSKQDSVIDLDRAAADPEAAFMIVSAPEVSETSLARSNGSTSRTFRRTTAADATFLTDCSFGISADRIVHYITDVEPFEPDWEGLTSIDLSGKKVESVVRMKDFLPNLDEVNLNDNQIAFLTGVPSMLRTLLVNSNRLSGLTSFQHLANLERVDVSDNQIDSVHQFACLKHLRELKADGNLISDLGGLIELDGLQRLSLRGNKLENVDLIKSKWTRLETLDMSRNSITSLVGIERLQQLTSLTLDGNALPSLTATSLMPRLRILRLSSNPITSITVSFAPKLRTLFIDSARLVSLSGLDSLRKLENLSVRDQSQAGSNSVLTLDPTSLRDIKRLYLSSNPSSLSNSLFSSPHSTTFFNLIYLELSHSQLLTLPSNLSSLIPNVRVLDLNHNPLTSLKGLEGLTRLTKLSVVGARLDKVKSLAQTLGSLQDLQTLDLRMNPLTLSFYPSFSTTLITSHTIINTSPSSPLTTGRTDTWPASDRHHRQTLSDEWYFRRLSYRSIILSLVTNLEWFDGAIVEGKERRRLKGVVEELSKTRG